MFLLKQKHPTWQLATTTSRKINKTINWTCAWLQPDTNIKLAQGNYVRKAVHHSTAADFFSTTSDDGHLCQNI
jgi:hypothetical protein